AKEALADSRESIVTHRCLPGRPPRLPQCAAIHSLAVRVASVPCLSPRNTHVCVRLQPGGVRGAALAPRGSAERDREPLLRWRSFPAWTLRSRGPARIRTFRGPPAAVRPIARVRRT